MIWYNNDDSSINITNQESSAKKYEKATIIGDFRICNYILNSLFFYGMD